MKVVSFGYFPNLKKFVIVPLNATTILPSLRGCASLTSGTPDVEYLT